jgi:plasmid stabilization system protein ParE
MSYTIIWQPTALNTYVEEIDFVFLKWNFKEVEKFQILVEENLERLAKKPTIGIYKKELNLYMLVLSKQTTLFYSINSIAKIIELNLFWNNSKNPDDLTKLLY